MSSASDPIQTLYNDFNHLLGLLREGGRASELAFVDGNFRKVLLLSAASFFERRMTDSLLDYTRSQVGDDHVIVTVVRSRAIERQYHTWFDWKANNINQFLKMFGAGFADHMKTVISSNNDLKDAVNSFLEIGRERNRLVHQDFVRYSMEKTSKEIYELYEVAQRFVSWFPRALQEYGAGVQVE